MGEKLTFHNLISEKNYTVEIPIIQRDYAQGRESASEIRHQFLTALKDYLSGNIPIELDFIYGSIIENGKYRLFTPLDGQQRLTTLFLLHWYLAVKENRLLEFRNDLQTPDRTKFSYETRITSRDFCNALISNEFSLSEDSANVISKMIKDSHWFFLSWLNDPTIKSMLVVIDEIQQIFSETDNFYEKLVRQENPIIGFQFIELKDFGLSDSLYVKMNSRGKELTEFENFKAKFEQYIDNLDKQNGTDIKTDFSKKIDTDWTDLFWNYRNSQTNVFDNQLMNFIRALAINNYALKPTFTHLIDNYIRIVSNSSKSLSFNQYDLDSECLQDIINTLDYLKNGSEKIKTFLDGKSPLDEEVLFDKVVQNNLTYPDRILFFSLYKYLIANNGETEGLFDWIRVIRNLTVNTNYDVERFQASIKGVNRLLESSSDILNFLSNPKSKIDGFAEIQIQEERIKAILLLKSDEWKETITLYEEHPYFLGQIDFLLHFSGINYYYKTNNHLDWTEEENQSFFELLNNYGDKAATMFRGSGLNDFGDYLWQRALLSKGNYLLPKSLNHSFLINDDRDISWKRLLRDNTYQRNYLRELFNDFDIKTVKADLERIIEQDDSQDWRRYFIKTPELLDVCGYNKFIRRDNESGEILLLEKSQTNGLHREYYSYALKIKLERLGNKVSYVESNSVDYLKYIYSINYKSIQLAYSYNQYNVKVSENKYEYFKTEQEIIEYLVQNKFIENPQV